MGSNPRRCEVARYEFCSSPKVIKRLTYCCLTLLFHPLEKGNDLFFHTDVVPFQLKIDGQPLYPGDLFRVVIQSPNSITQVEASFAGKSVVFFSGQDNHHWFGLAGIDLETKAEDYSIQGKLSFEHDRPQTFSKKLKVLPRKFPVQRIKVDEKYVTLNPEDAKRAEEENKKLDALWNTVSTQKVWQGRFSKPIPSELSTGFGRRRVVNNQPRSPHAGVDLKAPAGTSISAPNRGKVVLAEELFFSGKTVVLDHGLGLYTYYGHCSKLLVHEGELVEKGQVMAEVGSTGRVTGPHLHWACRLSRARIDPMKLTSSLLED